MSRPKKEASASSANTPAARVRHGLFALALAASVYFSLFGGRYTTADLIRIERARDLEAAALDSVQAQVRLLKAQIDKLRTDDVALERKAREAYGLIRDGELLIRFVPAEEADAASPQDGVSVNY